MKHETRNNKQTFTIIIVFVCLIIIGIGLVPFLNLQLNPSRTLPNLSVRYWWPEASARIIEKEVTAKLEGMFASVKGIEQLSSVTSRGEGRIDIAFKKHVNLDAARFEIANLIRQSYHELPEQVSYPQLSLNTSGQRQQAILSYKINASASPHYIIKYAENHIVPELAQIKGVGEVNVYGASPYEWQVEYLYNKLQNLNLTGDDIRHSINEYFREESLGKGLYGVQEDEYSQVIGLKLAMNRPDSLVWGNIPIKKVGGRIIYLNDIAKVQYKEQPPNAYYRINGLNTINMVVYPGEGANHIYLADKVKEHIKQLEKVLPVGYSLTLSYDTTEFLSRELNKILLRTLFSLGILLIFVLLISRQWRYLMLILISILANLIIAVIFYYCFKVEIHLYSLAGITISFGIIIDNSIVMIDHLRNKGDKKVFLAILAATLTTIGAMSVIFLLKESQQVNLIDFAIVIIVNLTVSMVIALYFIPALMDKIKLHTRKGRIHLRRKRSVLKLTSAYRHGIVFSKRFKWVYIVLLILGFGLPVHWLPTEIEKEGFWTDLYNETLGTEWMTDEARPILEKVLGGSLRLFTEYVFESSFYSEPERTTLHVRGSMPEGCTVKQLNEAIKKMENFISKFDEVEMFETSIRSYRNSNISIFFKPEYEWGSFPYYLKSELESKAISLGGLDWSVYGVGRGFSNALHTGYKNSRIMLGGYNYDQLYQYAELLKTKLLENPRIKEVDITGSSEWNPQVLHEYFVAFDKEQMALSDVNQKKFYSFLKDRAYRSRLSSVYNNNESQQVVLLSDTYEKFSVWQINNEPVVLDSTLRKFSQLASIEKRKSGNDIHKSNQQYHLTVAYDFIGPGKLSEMVMEQHVDKMNSILPMGYNAERRTWSGWNREEKSQYYLIGVILLIIYFICSILLESFKQPLAIISLIPVSFTGVFLTFYLFDLNFDQGGFASFIFLSGITVNSALFIINDYNNFRKQIPHQDNLKRYLKAFNYKIMPVLLTIISTVFGLIPFIWEGQNEVFWFAFASGAIGGLIFSLIAVVFYLPLFVKTR